MPSRTRSIHHPLYRTIRRTAGLPGSIFLPSLHGIVGWAVVSASVLAANFHILQPPWNFASSRSHIGSPMQIPLLTSIEEDPYTPLEKKKNECRPKFCADRHAGRRAMPPNPSIDRSCPPAHWRWPPPTEHTASHLVIYLIGTHKCTQSRNPLSVRPLPCNGGVL